MLLTINNKTYTLKGDFSQIVTLKTDPDKLPRLIIGIKLQLDNSFLYELNFNGTDYCYAFEDEIDWPEKAEDK